jgi:hypothetical protein
MTLEKLETVLDSMLVTGKELEATVELAKESGVFIAGLAVAAEQFGNGLEELTRMIEQAKNGTVH